MKQILILGSAGFVGKTLIVKLKNKNYKIKALIFKNEIKLKGQKIKGDILKPGLLDRYIEDGDIVVNLIGQLSGDDVNFSDLNIRGGLNLLESCVKKKRVKIVLISSINVYGENIKRSSIESDLPRPSSIYGNVKLLTEKIYQNYSEVYGLDVIVLRLANLYGPNKKAGPIPSIISSIKNKSSFSAFNKGKQQRDFIFIDDAIDGIIQAIKNPIKGFNIFNISTGKRFMIKEVIKNIERISKKNLKVVYNEKIPDEECIWANNQKSKKILKFKPKISLEEGLKITLEKEDIINE